MSWWRRKPKPVAPPVLEGAGWTDLGSTEEDDVTPEPETAELTVPGYRTELRKGDQVKVVTTPEQEAQARWDGWK